MKIKIRKPTYEEELRNVQLKRAVEYPSITDQLDAIMKWIATEKEFTAPQELKSIAMQAMAVKSRYPKPEKKND